MTKYKFTVSTGYVGSTREAIFEIPDDEFGGLSEEEKDDYIYKNYKKEILFCLRKKVSTL